MAAPAAAASFRATAAVAFQLLREGRDAADIPIPTASSSAIGRAEWNPLTWDLDITFAGKKAAYGNYTFPGVPLNTVAGLAAAGSKGKYYHRRLKRLSANSLVT